ncbi:MAG: CinA family nicotinamide mononucleotide deamidase-related protein [Saprospiraceae bacterium]
MYTATILTIGDELLIGQTIDTNSTWIGQELSKLGIVLKEKLSVTDTKKGIVSGLQRVMIEADIIIVTGGLGPTKDDITKDVLAEYFGMKMVFDQATYDRIVRLFRRWEKPLTSAIKNQCNMPDDCTLLDNKMGTAPGMLFEIDNKIIICMPGVPFEMKYIMENSVIPLIKDRFKGQSIVHYTIMTACIGESRIADMINDIVSSFPKHISIAYLPSLGSVKLRLTANGENRNQLESEVKNIANNIVDIIGSPVYGYNEQKIEQRIGELAIQKNITIGTAESCTGGKICSQLVSISGSSQYYKGSAITYSNKLKHKMLDVSLDTLNKYGAVSKKVVIEMVKGGTKNIGVDVVIAISGIAGPSGGSEEKPVGTTWIACGTIDNIKTMKIQGGKNREKNIAYAAYYALDMLRLYLEEM